MGLTKGSPSNVTVDVASLVANPIFQAALVVAGATPSGAVMSTVAATAPTGYLLLDGSTVTNGQTLYPNLWAAIPTAWKSGANILLPDARGRTIIGAGTGTGLTARTLGAANIGVEDVTLSAAQSGQPGFTVVQNSHVHTASSGTESVYHQHGPGAGTNIANRPASGTGGPATSSGLPFTSSALTANQNALHTHGITVDAATATNQAVAAAAAASAHTNMQPSIVLNWIIKT